VCRTCCFHGFLPTETPPLAGEGGSVQPRKGGANRGRPREAARKTREETEKGGSEGGRRREERGIGKERKEAGERREEGRGSKVGSKARLMAG
jgi:hypothetical protein